MTSLRRWLTPSLAAVLVLAGCSSPDPTVPEQPEAPGEFVASNKEREPAPNVAAENFSTLVAGNTDFGAALYRELTEPGENLFFSPFSITQAFSMVYAGARGTTEEQMAQALHFTLPQDQHHPAMNALDLALNAHAGVAGEDPGTPPSLRLVNATWGQKGLTFEPQFLDVLAQHYGSGMRVVDFAAEPDAIRQGINAWVEGQTEGRIQDLIPEEGVTGDTRLLLVNALYFKGAWRTPFDPKNTQSAPFLTLSGAARPVDMMRVADMIPRAEGDGYEAIAIPYVGRAFRMLVIVPHQGRFAEIESRLSAEFLDSVRAGLQSQYLNLGFPKFDFKSDFPLVEPMKALGMEEAFSDQANLSGLTRQMALMLTHSQHQAFVSVDEEGTEAAAATSISASPISIPAPYTVNRPFLFLIEDVETKAVLFLGRFVNP